MLGYYLRLALKSFARAPGLTTVMVSAIALGIGVCIVTLTIYHAMSRNPISWKSERLFAVTMDSWDPNKPADLERPQLPPAQLTYKDALYLFSTSIPERKVVMYARQSVLLGGMAQQREPVPISTRVTTADFFAMFDVPFLYGRGWGPQADREPQPVIVLSKQQNERLFGGANSVGRTVRWDDHELRIIGVLDAWFPMPKFYDLNNGSFAEPEDVYIPFGWTTALQRYPNGGGMNCWRSEKLDSFRDLLGSECVWTQMWVELPDRTAVRRMQGLLDAYWLEQRKAARFPRPRNNRLTDVGQWLKDRGVVRNDNRLLVAVAFAFLAVCLINTVGILLARFHRRAAVIGLQRALGATRRQIFVQHFVEMGILAIAGAMLGLGLSAAGLEGIHSLYTVKGAADTHLPLGGYQQLTRFDEVSVGWAIVLAIVSTLAAGIYPAWRTVRQTPATYLKGQ